MEYAAKEFERRHDYVDANGTRVPLFEKLDAIAKDHDHHRNGGSAENRVADGNDSLKDLGASSLRSSELVESVLLAAGIHHHVKKDLLEDMPERFEQGNVKARITWFGLLCLGGVGMFVEAYIIITTGQIKTVWHDQYPECFIPDEDQHCPSNIQCCDLFPNTPEFDNGTCAVDTTNNTECNADGTYESSLLCSEEVVNSISYGEFAGIMFGMVTFGAICDIIGRKSAGMLTSALMFVGIIFMTLYKDPNGNLQDQFIVFSVFFGVFGMGVGGEYPLTASGAAEHHAESQAEAQMDDEEHRRHRVLAETARTARRGETISLVFAMQGVGAVFGSFVLLLLIYFSDQLRVTCDDPASNSSGNDPHALNSVWRAFYMIGFIFIIMLLLYRSLVLEEGKGREKLLERKRRREEKLKKLGHPGAPGTFKILQFYAPRLIGTGFTWFMWDIAFYGLKLFSGPIFDQINPSGDLVVTNGWILFNNLCAMAGYYASAMVIDMPQIGRLRLQLASFAIEAFLFFTTAAIFNTGKSQTLMFLFFASSFFGNFGANVTTYVMAAETYPSELRATCHGISAFLGKTGALVATIVFTQLATDMIFYICGAVSVAGFIFSFFFSVDLTLVSTAEHDAQLELFLEGRPEAYKGKLNDRQHLSRFEIWSGRHGQYDPTWARKLVDEEKKKTLHGTATSTDQDLEEVSLSQPEQPRAGTADLEEVSLGQPEQPRTGTERSDVSSSKAEKSGWSFRIFSNRDEK